MGEAMTTAEHSALLLAFNLPEIATGPNPLVETDKRWRAKEREIAAGQCRVLDWVRDHA